MAPACTLRLASAVTMGTMKNIGGLGKDGWVNNGLRFEG